jgi:hypothetical protein
MPDARTGLVRALLISALALTAAACSGEKAEGSAPPKDVPASALEKALLSVTEVNRVMGTTAMVEQPVVQAMDDDRNLLPNLNCLGIWQPDQAAIYGEQGSPDGWVTVRHQTMRAPDSDDWSSIVHQSIANYPSADAAKKFFTESADRWSKCTNHTVNIQLNDKPLPKWRSGDLKRTDTQLAISIARGVGTDSRVCQHVLSVYSNVIIDVEACRPTVPVVTAASEIALNIQKSLPS